MSFMKEIIMNRSRSHVAPSMHSRRGFLKIGGQVAAASALAGVGVPAVHAAADETIKLAIVGIGGRGSGAIVDAFGTRGGPVKLHAIAEVFENKLQDRLKSFQSRFSDKVDVTPDRCFVGFDAYKKAIDTLSPGDVVILTTPAAFRPTHFEYAVQKGVNVFMEKSFATDSPGVRRMLKSAELSEQKNLKVGAGFMWRHSQARQETIKRIHDGAIGDINTLRIYRVHGPHNCPARPKDQNEVAFQIQHPMSFNWLSGSFFVDWHCHNIDVACWVKNAWPVSAQGMGGRCYAEVGNLFDHYCVEYTFADGAKLFAFSRHMDRCWNTYSDHAQGTRGSALIMADLGNPAPKIYKSQKMVPEEVVWKFEGQEPNPYVEEWQVLVDAIRQGKPHNESRRAAEADLAAIMGRVAAHTGAFVTWDAAMKSDFQYVKDIDALTFDTPAPIASDAEGRYAAPVPGLTKEM